jgi:hypothetical protein
LFKIKDLPIASPNYSPLSKRLKELNIKSPQYKKAELSDDKVHAIAIDSKGLKRFGRGDDRL